LVSEEVEGEGVAGVEAGGSGEVEVHGVLGRGTDPPIVYVPSVV